jgi:hypothetical protein
LGFAQPSINWMQQISGTGWQGIDDLITDGSGNVYALGDFQGNTLIGQDELAIELKPTDVNGLFVAKFDRYGQLTWAKQLNGNGGVEACKLGLDPFGNVYFCGNFSPQLFVDHDAYKDTLTCKKGKDNTFICKLTAEGAVIWLKNFESAYHNDPGDFAVDSKGNLLVLGRFETKMDFDPGSGTAICRVSEY